MTDYNYPYLAVRVENAPTLFNNCVFKGSKHAVCRDRLLMQAFLLCRFTVSGIVGGYGGFGGMCVSGEGLSRLIMNSCSFINNTASM